MLNTISENSKDGKKKKKDLVIKRFFDLQSKLHLQRKCNPSSLHKYAYVLLDTSNTSTELSSETVFGWNIVNFVTLQKGTVSIIGKLRDIIGMRLYPVTATFTVPIPAPGKKWISDVVNLDYNFTILIKEFQAQSYNGHDGSKFHFVMYPNMMSNGYLQTGYPFVYQNAYVEYTTIGKGNGWFWFKTPITLTSTMSLQVGDPFDLLQQRTAEGFYPRMIVPIQLIYLNAFDDN
jgi:hypothetical protein